MVLLSLLSAHVRRIVLAHMRASALPASDSLSQLDSVIRRRASEIAEIAVGRFMTRLRWFLLVAPPLVSIVAGCTSLALTGDAFDALASAVFGGLPALLVSALSLLALSDIDLSNASRAAHINGVQYLEAFGGTPRIPMRLLARVFSAPEDVRAGTIASAAAWEVAQLSPQQRAFLQHNASSDLTLGELLAAFDACELAPSADRSTAQER